MPSTSQQYIRIVLIFFLALISHGIFGQTRNDTVNCDTSTYVPIFFPGSVDYNLMIASSNGCISEISRLLNLGADVLAQTEQGATPLIFAVANNHMEAVRLLIENGSDPNQLTKQGETPLFISVKNQNDVITETLIRAGAAIDTIDKYGATPLHYASIYDYFQIADMLLYYDASVNIKTREGTTPLLAAVWAGNADIADLLIQNGADIEAKDNDGFTPYLMATLNGDTLIMNLLQKKGANIYVTDKFGQNALSISIIAGKIEITKFLLSAGSKWQDQGKQTVNPYVAASKYSRKDIIELLNEYKFPGNLSYQIDQVNIALSSRFSLHDIYTGTSFSFKEPFINGGIIAGFDTKLWYTRVLIRQSENTYYQYFNKESLIYAGLFKNFSLTDNPFSNNFEVSTSLSAGYIFGNQFKGSLNAPSDKLVVIPSASIIWKLKDISVSLAAEYIKNSFYHTGPVWLRFGVSYNLYFDNVRFKKKTLKWY